MSDFDEFTTEERGGSPFLPLLGLLGGILVLAILCGAIFLIARGLVGGDGEEDVVNITRTAVAIANATTLAENARVTETLMAMTEEASRPTATSTPTITPTDTPPPTAAPTDTPVVIDLEPTATSTAILEGTSIFGGGGLGTATPLPGGGGGGTGTGGGGTGTLPDTGFSLAGAVALAVGLLLVFVVARRLRTS